MVFFVLEASKPSGAYYRLSLGCYSLPLLASMVVALSRFF
jgi:hypothetical protein